MPVNTKCGVIANKSEIWKMLTCVNEGEEAIKAAGDAYLPRLSGQTNDEYDSYKVRGTFFNAFARTVQGLTGAATRKDAIIDVAPELDESIDDMTGTGISIHELARSIVMELLVHGYIGALVDVAPSTSVSGTTVRPYVAMYEAESILNVRKEKNKDGIDELIFLALMENIVEPDPEDEFKEVTVEQVRVWRKDDAGNVFVQLWRKNAKGDWMMIPWPVLGSNGKQSEEYYPKILGKPLTTIPFQFFGSMENDPYPQKPPLADLAYLNVKHWQLSVDYYHGLHFCALPTPWAAGFDPKETLHIGCAKAWVTKNPEAKAGYLEFSGQGIGAIEKALDSLERKMTVMGARMLEEQKAAAEATETVRLRHSGDSATLSNIADNAEKGLVGILEYMLAWMNKAGAKVDIQLNKDFVSTRLAALDITALLQTYIQGGISLDTFLRNLQEGEILPEDITPEEEKLRIESDAAKGFRDHVPEYM